VFAAAEDFVINSKSDGILILPTRHGLLEAAARWYIERAIATGRLSQLALVGGYPMVPPEALPHAKLTDDSGDLLRVTLASTPS
jgi:hypothetical protein